MNVTINRAEMLSAIKRASAVAPADSPLDVLRGVLLEADAAAGKLTVTSTNLEAALEEKLPCTVQEDGRWYLARRCLQKCSHGCRRIPCSSAGQKIRDA